MMTSSGTTNRRHSVARWCLTGLVAATILAASPPAPANADQRVAIEWDGPAIGLDWRGATQVVAGAEFVGSTTVVPGDQVTRTALVKNAGPTDATATVTLTQTGPPNAEQPELQHALLLEWDIAGHQGEQTWADTFANDQTMTVTFQVAQGETFPITIGYRLPAATTTAQNPDPSTPPLTFNVTITLRGATGTPSATDTPNPTGTTTQTSSNSGSLPFTGTEWLGLAAAAAILTLTGSALLTAARRRRNNEA